MNMNLKKKLENFTVEQLEQRKEFTFYFCVKPQSTIVVTKSGGSQAGGDTGGGIPY
ncbi:hypothetical protein [Chryseobacterium sp.]|uniref:hypothetical protein n=1 Tax=Chryseobacterium sp. TaxID=1871047 RepID=UPI0031D9B17D